METKLKRIERENMGLNLLINQEVVDLSVLRECKEIKENHNLLAFIDIIIYRLWNGALTIKNNSKEVLQKDG